MIQNTHTTFRGDSNYSYHKEGSKGETYNDCYTKEEHGKDHDYCQTSEPYKKFHIYIDEHATKVVFYITDNVMKKEEKKKLEVYITKYFKAEYGDDYNYPEYRKNYDEVIIYLICDDYKEEIKLDEHGKYYSADRYDLYGKKNCYFREYFKDDEYKLYKTTYTYKFDYKEEKSVYSTAYYDHERPDYETTSSKEHKFDFDHKYGKFTGDFYNYMKPKQEQRYPS